MNVQHLPSCTTKTLAELFRGEPKPSHLSDHAWSGVRFSQCVDGCPVMERAKARGRELAARHGW